jgi:hypothetical protein
MEKESQFLGVIDKVLIPIIVAFITYIIARKQITNSSVTQFRQRWIDDLRNAVSLYIAKAELIQMLKIDDDEGYFQHFTDFAQTQHKIELLLNPTDGNHGYVIICLENLRETAHWETEVDPSVVRDEIINLIDAVRAVIKDEWLSIKKGK